MTKDQILIAILTCNKYSATEEAAATMPNCPCHWPGTRNLRISEPRLKLVGGTNVKSSEVPEDDL